MLNEMLTMKQDTDISSQTRFASCPGVAQMLARCITIVLCLCWLTPSWSTELKCTLEHKEVLPEETEFLPGAPFLESQLPKIGGVFNWYKVPDWLVGQWHREEEISVGAQGAAHPKISKSRADMVYGHQTDEDGNIWAFYQQPYWQKIDSSPYIYYKLTKSFIPMWLENGHFAIRTISDDVKLLKSTGKVEEIWRREEIHEIWRRKDDNKVSAVVSIRQFDLKGLPTLTAATHYDLTKTAPFREVAFWTEGEDLKASLEYWLSKHSSERAGTELKPNVSGEPQPSGDAPDQKATQDPHKDTTFIDKAREQFAQDKAAQEEASARQKEQANQEKSDQ